MAENDDVLEKIAFWSRAGKRVALATVVGTWGSSPRPTGSLMAVEEGGNFVGSVSGGCVEGAVVTEGLDVIKGGPSRLRDYGISNDQAWSVGLACGGEMKVFVEPAPDPDLAERLLAERPAALVTELESGRRALVDNGRVAGELVLDDETVALARQALRDNRSTLLEDGELFVAVYNPPLRMAIVGAVHVAQCLAPMAALAGFAVTVIDPRGSFATEFRFPGVGLDRDWPDEALAVLQPDSRTAIVTLTHDPKLDDPALAAALRSEAYYIGALGSRKTHARRIERLLELGFNDGAIGRIRAPIGLPLGGRKASEIAVSILAEAVAESHGVTNSRQS